MPRRRMYYWLSLALPCAQLLALFEKGPPVIEILVAVHALHADEEMNLLTLVGVNRLLILA